MKGTLKSAEEVRKMPEVSNEEGFIDFFVPEGKSGYDVPVMLFKEDEPKEISITAYQIHEDGSRYYGTEVKTFFGDRTMWFKELFFVEPPKVEEVLGYAKIRSKEDLEKVPNSDFYVDEEEDLIYRWKNPEGANKIEVEVAMLDDIREYPYGFPVVRKFNWYGKEVYVGFVPKKIKEGVIYSQIHLVDGIHGEFKNAT